MCLFDRTEDIKITLALGGLGVEEQKIYDRVREIFLSRLDSSATGREKVENIYALVEELMAEFLENNQIACHRGCPACCYQLVHCTTLEMELIVQHLESLPRQSRRSIIQRVNKESRWLIAFVKKLCPNGLPSRWELLAKPLRAVYFGIRPCPFLNSMDACSIYPVRPFDCRTARTQNPKCGNRIHVPGERPGEIVVEEPEGLIFLSDQVASDLILGEEERVKGAMQLVPLPAWALTPDFYDFFMNRQSQPKQRPKLKKGKKRKRK